MAEFIDIACNFTHPSLKENLDEIMLNAENVGVKKFVLVSSNLSDLKPIEELKSINPLKFYITGGIHPHHAKEIENLNYDSLLKVLAKINPDAIGETGLDYFRNLSKPDTQRESFKMHIKIAQELSLPLYLHQRDAHKDFINIIKNINGPFPRFVVHCFTGNQKELDHYLDLGAYIGLTGWICDANRNKNLRASIKNIPLNRLMLETDSPYLVPKNLPERPKKNINEPKHLPHIAKEVSKLMGVSIDTLKESTYQNTLRFFN
jgi:TatD DNase family protein